MRDVRNELGEWVTDEKSSLPAERKAVACIFERALRRRSHLIGATQLSKSKSYVALETSLTPRQPSAPGRAVTENMKLNMAGSGDLIGGQQNPPSRLPGGVKLGGCYRNPGGTMLQFG